MIIWDRPFDLFLLHLPLPPHYPAGRLDRSVHHISLPLTALSLPSSQSTKFNSATAHYNVLAQARIIPRLRMFDRSPDMMNSGVGIYRDVPRVSSTSAK